VNAASPLTIQPEFWLNRELSKIKDSKRRQWLAEKVFVGKEGYLKFVKILCQREGALEFETGEWQKTLPKFTHKQLVSKRPKCIGGCGKTFPPLTAPWGELIEDIPAICRKCKNRIKPKETNMSDNKPDATKDVQDILAQLETKKQTLKTDLKSTLDAAMTQLNVLLNPQLGFTFESIFSGDEFQSAVETFHIQVKQSNRNQKPAEVDNTAEEKPSRTGKKGALKKAILKLLEDGKERKRPEIKAALEKKGISTSNLYGKSGVAGLVASKQLIEHGEGRATTYKIAK